MAGHYIETAVNLTARRVLQGTVLISKMIREYSALPVGCGILLLLEDEYFLVTAAHILSDSTWSQLVIPGANNATVTLQGELRTTYLSPDRKSKIDFSVLRLYQKMHRHLSIYRPFEVSDILINHQVQDIDKYLVAGFPYRKVKKVAGSKTFIINPLRFITNCLREKRYKRADIDPNLFIMLQFQRRLQAYGSGRIQDIGNPQGISGSGLYFLPDLGNPRPETVHPFLIGILIENHQDRGFMLAMRIDMIIEVIRTEFKLGNLQLPTVQSKANLGILYSGDYMERVEIEEQASRTNGEQPK